MIRKEGNHIEITKVRRSDRAKPKTGCKDGVRKVPKNLETDTSVRKS